MFWKIWLYTHTHVHSVICACVYITLYTHIYARAYMCIYIYTHVYAHMRTHIRVCVCNLSVHSGRKIECAGHWGFIWLCSQCRWGPGLHLGEDSALQWWLATQEGQPVSHLIREGKICKGSMVLIGNSLTPLSRCTSRGKAVGWRDDIRSMTVSAKDMLVTADSPRVGGEHRLGVGLERVTKRHWGPVFAPRKNSSWES